MSNDPKDTVADSCQSWCVVNRKHQQKHLYLLFQEVPYLQCLQVAMRALN